MNTNYNNDVAGALKLITINGSVYQLGKDASTSEGGIMKLFGGSGALDTYKTSTDGAYDAKTVYDAIAAAQTAATYDDTAIQAAIDGLEDALGEGFSSSATVAAAVAAAKSVVALGANEAYLSLSSAADATDGHMVYTISTTGIDSAISAAVAAVVNGAPAAFDTLKEISDWITADTTGAAAILADVTNKADKVSSAVSGNFAGLDANGNLTDSGYKAADFQAAGSYKTTQTAVADPTTGSATNTYEFIATISQNANGEISATKQVVRAASASQSGLMSSSDYSKLAAISATVSGDTLTITTQAAA
jgi:hypothetical protein